MALRPRSSGVGAAELNSSHQQTSATDVAQHNRRPVKARLRQRKTAPYFSPQFFNFLRTSRRTIIGSGSLGISPGMRVNCLSRASGSSRMSLPGSERLAPTLSLIRSPSAVPCSESTVIFGSRRTRARTRRMLPCSSGTRREGRRFTRQDCTCTYHQDRASWVQASGVQTPLR